MASGQSKLATAQFNRRDLLTASVAATTAAAVSNLPLPAQAATETPVMRAYREYRAYAAWLNGPATNGMPTEEFDDLVDVLTDKVEQLVATPSETLMDTIIKFSAVVEDYQLFAHVDGLAPLEVEARALIGA